MNELEQFWKKYGAGGPVTFVLIAINLVFFIITIFAGGFDTYTLSKLGAIVPMYITENHEYYRLLLAMFLHGGFIHFLMNMYALYYLGRSLERSLGPWKYGILYFVSGIGSGLFVVLLSQSNSVTIGASGAIFGIIGALLLITYIRKDWFTPRSIQSIRFMVILNLIITLIVPNVSAAGHLGGFIVGLALGYFLIPKKPYFMRKVVEYYAGGEVVGDGDPTIIS